MITVAVEPAGIKVGIKALMGISFVLQVASGSFTSKSVVYPPRSCLNVDGRIP